MNALAYRQGVQKETDVAKLVLEILDHDSEGNFYTHFCFDEFETKQMLCDALDKINRETPGRIKAAQALCDQWDIQNPSPKYAGTLSGPECEAFAKGPYREWDKKRPKLESPTINFYGAVFVAPGYGASGHRDFRAYTLEEWFEKEAAERKNQIKIAI